MPGPDERYFVTPPRQVNLADLNATMDRPESNVVRVRMPQWATEHEVSRLVRAITLFRYARMDTARVRIYVPIRWLTPADRMHGTDGPGSLLGIPYTYAEVSELIVGWAVE